MPLVTKNVFIDTEFFIRANLDFHSTTIKSFENLCSDDELNHMTTTVVIQEVKSKISNKINEALKDIRKFKQKAVILKEYDDETIKMLFKEIDEKDFEKKALESFDNFIDASNTTVIDLKDVDSNEIMNMFFSKKAPFSVEKPNEFRDAFSLLALQSKLNSQEKIYIVSSDPDLKKFCEENENFVSVDTLSSLLDIYNKHNDERSQFIENFMIRKKEDIKTAIKEQLEQADAYNLSSWDDSEIDYFEVLEIDDFNPEIIHIDDENCLIRFDVNVKFIVDATGPDFKNGIYNKEEGRMYAFDKIDRQEEETHNFSVELELDFKSDVDGFIADDFDLYIHGAIDIEFSVEEEPQYAYY